MEDKKVELNLGLVCNNLCKFCINDTPLEQRFFTPFKVIEKELREYYKKGYRTVGFLGGEPTIYPKIVEVVSLARRLGYNDIQIVSNGRRYKDKKFLEKLIRSGVTRFYISIHSHKARIEDYLTSVKGSFQDKIQGLYNLKYFKKKGMVKDKIFLNSVINKFNYKYLTQIILFYYKMGFFDFRFNFIRPEGRAFTNGKLIVPKYFEVMKYVKKVIDLVELLKINLTFEAIPFCLFCKFKIKDFKDYIGEFRDAQTEAIFGEDDKRDRFLICERRKNQLRGKRKICQSCIFDSACEGPWKTYTEVYGFQEFKPIN